MNAGSRDWETHARIAHFTNKPRMILVNKAQACQIVWHCWEGGVPIGLYISLLVYRYRKKKKKKKHLYSSCQRQLLELCPVAKFHAQIWQF